MLEQLARLGRIGIGSLEQLGRGHLLLLYAGGNLGCLRGAFIVEPALLCGRLIGSDCLQFRGPLWEWCWGCRDTIFYLSSGLSRRLG